MARPKKSQGLGDTIEKITEATGIKKAVEMFTEATGIDCGCNERKEKLNKLFTYRKKVNCLNESDYNALKEYVKPSKGRLTPKEQQEIKAIYYRTFDVMLEDTSCGSCWRDVIGELRKVFNEYDVNA